MLDEFLLIGVWLVSFAVLTACDQNPNNPPTPPDTPGPVLVLAR
jgi:hypothetical protein